MQHLVFLEESLFIKNHFVIET